MAVTFFPFNSIVVDGVPDRPANAENLAAYLAGFFGNGVVMQEDTALKVEAYSGMEVQIHAGMGNINGKTILNDASEIITLAAANASLARIDRVVFRLDEVNRLMEFDVLTGTPASSPTVPALTQTAEVYEMCLAEIIVPAGATSIAASHIIDTRAETDLCGIARLPNHTHDITDVGAISIEKLWENASPTSNFENQEINCEAIYDYRFFLVKLRQSTGNSASTNAIIARGSATDIQKVINMTGSSTPSILNRQILASSSGYLSFGDCNSKKYNSTSANTDNSFLIPLEIYGIKGVK